MRKERYVHWYIILERRLHRFQEETPKEEEEEVDSDSESWHTDYGSDEEGDEDINLNETEVSQEMIITKVAVLFIEVCSLGYISIQALPISSCLFCHKESSSLESSLDHMKTRHDFVIPDRQFCIDKEGLMEYLCLKVRSRASLSTVSCIPGGSRSYVCVLSREKSGIPHNRCSSTTYGGEATL